MAGTKDLRNDLEDIAKDTVSKLKGRASEAGDKAAKALDQTKEKAQLTASKVDDYARENPWHIAGAVLVAGILIGLLAGNRKK